MPHSIHLNMTSAEDFNNSLIGKEVVPNLVHYLEDFKAVFPKAGLMLGEVFTVVNEKYYDGERYVWLENDERVTLPSQAYRFIVLDP